jgi:DNA-binding response OmpR family regulator
MKVLVISANAPVRDPAVDALRRAGHQVDTAADLPALRLASRRRVELVVLDACLPDLLAQIGRLRADGDLVPLLAIGCPSHPGDRIALLEAGVDDLLTHPFTDDEFIARVEALARRCGIGLAVQRGPLAVDHRARRATLMGTPLDLTEREYDLLHALMRAPGQVLSRAVLLERVWGVKRDPGTNVVDVYIRYLRTKLSVHPIGPTLVQTVRGVGYRLDLPGERAAPAPAWPAAEAR